MAGIDINPSAIRHQRGFARKHRSLSLRIDMTLMVDLGFLLITFFIFTSALSEPNTMNLFMPETDGPPSLIPQSGALTIMIDKEGKLSYYEGAPAADGSNFTQSTLSQIRKEIIRKKLEVISKYIPDAACEAKAVANKKSIDDCRQKNLTVLIKPTADADYKTIVAILDEMAINKIARYVLADPDENELAALHFVK
ncbi:MAG TPA: biopolymer transporter ExbD [Niabella sp.]|nr:biopolymer transporter ExbD [Niabella sp.]